MSAPVVTRFAPSPTGYLHIGGARTALFNWLYARHTGGTMLLRIEDTDRERSTEAAIAAILDGLTWLGLDWEGEPISQFARAARHREVAEELVARGKAYRGYATPEELDEMRDKARAEGRFAALRRPLARPRPVRGAAPASPVDPHQGAARRRDGGRRPRAGRVASPTRISTISSSCAPTARRPICSPSSSTITTWASPTSSAATTTSPTPARQTIIYDAMGWDVPVMAHIPLIHGADGAKLSKRHGALGVDAYRAMGYLPEALRNYLARLGWSHGDDEIMSTERDDRAGSTSTTSASRRRASTSRSSRASTATICAPWTTTGCSTSSSAALPHLREWRGVRRGSTPDRDGAAARRHAGLKERAKTLVELLDGAAFLFAERPLVLDEAAAALVDADARHASSATLGDVLAAVDDWTRSRIEAAVRAMPSDKGLKLGEVAQPLRAALTGRATSPGVFDVLAVLGREESLARIGDKSISGQCQAAHCEHLKSLCCGATWTCRGATNGML